MKKVQQTGQKKVGLIGTDFTMNGDFYKKPFEEKNISIVTPSKDDRKKVNSYVVQELEQGILRQSTKKYLVQVVDNMVATQQIEGIILGCTEIPMILSQEDFGITVYDTTQNHVEAIVDEMFSKI